MNGWRRAAVKMTSRIEGALHGLVRVDMGEIVDGECIKQGAAGNLHRRDSVPGVRRSDGRDGGGQESVRMLESKRRSSCLLEATNVMVDAR